MAFHSKLDGYHQLAQGDYFSTSGTGIKRITLVVNIPEVNGDLITGLSQYYARIENGLLQLHSVKRAFINQKEIKNNIAFPHDKKVVIDLFLDQASGDDLTLLENTTAKLYGMDFYNSHRLFAEYKFNKPFPENTKDTTHVLNTVGNPAYNPTGIEGIKHPEGLAPAVVKTPYDSSRAMINANELYRKELAKYQNYLDTQ